MSDIDKARADLEALIEGLVKERDELKAQLGAYESGARAVTDRRGSKGVGWGARD